MMLKRSLLAVLFFLILTLTESDPGSAATNKQVIILDLAYLELEQVSAAYPNLLRLVTDGSVGLVKVPAAFRFGITSTGPLGLLVSKVWQNDSMQTLAACLSKQGLPGELAATIVPRDGFYEPGNWQPRPFQNRHQLPSHIKISLDSLIDNYRQRRGSAQIIIISLGDLGGAVGSKNSMANGNSESSLRILSYYDYLMAGIFRATNFNSTLLMVSGAGSPIDQANNCAALMPIIIKGIGFSSGVLYSSSTRLRGILTWHDLQATLLRTRDSKTANGSKLIKNLPGDWRVIAKAQTALVKNYLIRWPLLTGFGYLWLGTVLSLAAGVILRLPSKIITAITWVYLYLLLVPAVFLLEVLFNPLNWLSISAYTLGIGGVLFSGAYLLARKNIFQTLFVISLLTMAIVVGDALLNGRYEHKAFLGYSVVAGARYYGIGNEYMGILLGAYILGVALSLRYLERWRRQILWCGTILISIILIHPHFGADVGGGITAILGLGITNYLWLKQPVRIMELLKLVGITLIVFTLAGIWDLQADPNSMSHLGQLLLTIRDHGVGAFIVMAKRKFELNMHLISSAPIALVLIGFLTAIPFFYRYPSPWLKAIINNHDDLSAGFTGLCLTALLGMVTNDSGIVSAGLIFVFGIGLLLALFLKEQLRIES